MIFWLGFSLGAFLMFLLGFAWALMATAADADQAMHRYFETTRREREVRVTRGLDLPIPPKEERPRT